ncbi:DUF4442 domain-containing protein [Allohahella sp. A8]|uniref:DUF4442 domain-containing protein n=1 Tax=Allohahella sp. A8 TaxID=3141461 RepID=UPI000C0B0AAC|nr:DUF4442 domain-containing protein [Hahellaceae bacterium]|tara:strand:+ start:89518 stop:90000 length:483 start_codon:yes stop_codon:yes gene_type:complete
MNKLASIVGRINGLPGFARSRALTLFFNRLVKYAGTSGTVVEKLTTNHCIVTLKNRKRVQNHIGSVHAVACALIAESATGFVVGMNVPDDKVPVIKSMNIDYVKRAKGDMRAEARLTAAQIQAMKTQDKGEAVVEVVITDAEGKSPLLAKMVWAWTPKRR